MSDVLTERRIRDLANCVPSTSVINFPLFDKVLAHIDAHPEEWEQETWGTQASPCKTSFCVAGHIANMDPDVTLIWETDEPFSKLPQLTGVHHNDTGEIESIKNYAQAQLGLTSLEGAYLFTGSNTREDLQTYYDYFASIAHRIQ